MNLHRPFEIKPAEIKPHHERLAVVYLRQSTPHQVQTHAGSTMHERDQRQFALGWGWSQGAIVVIDDDLGLPGQSAAHQAGFQRLLKLIERREVGAIFISDPSRLTRSSREFEIFLAFCRVTDTLLVVGGAIADLNDHQDGFVARI